MTAAPHFAPVDAETSDLLTLLADITAPVGRDVPTLFLDACRQDAASHAGLVSVNRVRTILSSADIPPRRYSALWSHFTGRGKPMLKTSEWETCSGSSSGNDGRPFPLRRWVGSPPP